MPSGHGRTTAARVATATLLMLALVALILVIRSSATGYAIDLRFSDAGQLVTGDDVQVGGHKVGSVKSISITADGLADVRVRIDDAALRPLHSGTTASIGSPGLSGVANRFVRLVPGPGDAAAIPDGGLIGPDQTHGIVDLDMLLDDLDSRSRTRLREILRQNAAVVATPAQHQANAAFALLNPALSRTAALGGELLRDQAALEQLVSSTATTAAALEADHGGLGRSIAATATVMRELASRRLALGDTLAAAPSVLTQASGVLARTRPALAAVDPVLLHLRPVAPLAGRLLRQVVPVARNAGPAIADVRRLLVRARGALATFPALAATTVPALHSAVAAFTALQPIVTGLRAYTPDLLAGFYQGFGGNQAGYYDANGHFARILVVRGPGSLGATPPGGSGAGSAAGYTTGLTARCPGAASEPSPDRSSPFVPADSPNLCDPAQTPSP